MSEFRKVEHAVAGPTSCVGCGTHQGPFIDMGIALPVYGALYLCLETETRSGCVGQMATMNGGLTRASHIRLIEQLEELEGELAKTKAELRTTQGSKLLKVEDLLRYGAQTGSNGGKVTITLGG